MSVCDGRRVSLGDGPVASETGRLPGRTCSRRRTRQEGGGALCVDDDIG